MSKGNMLETELLQHILENADISNVGDATGLRGSTTAGSLYISLHTADPGETGDQTTNEATYTGYARVGVTREDASWTIANGAAENAAEIAFPAATGGSNTITHFGIGTASSGAGKLLYKGALTDPLAVSNGITPKFAAGDLDVTED